MICVNLTRLGDLLTNNDNNQNTIHPIKELEDMSRDGRYDLLTKKEFLRLERERKHLEQNLAGIKEMAGPPDALFVGDPDKGKNAVLEGRKMGVPGGGIVGTNSDPDLGDYVVPGNDDALTWISPV